MKHPKSTQRIKTIVLILCVLLLVNLACVDLGGGTPTPTKTPHTIIIDIRENTPTATLTVNQQVETLVASVTPFATAPVP